MDYLHIEKLFFNGKHGVYDSERKVEQEFEVSVRIGLNTKQAGESDKLADTLDYQKAKRAIAEIIEGSSRYLVERLAEDIAARILKESLAATVEVSIRKIGVWDNGVPGVTIVREK